MSFRRMMLFALDGSLVNTIIQNLKDFILIITLKNGVTFEAESCSVTDLTELEDKNTLNNANFILLPNNSTEAEILPTLPVPTDDIRNLIFRTEGKTASWTLQQITAVLDGTITDPFGTQRTLRLTEVAATTPHTFNQLVPNFYGYLSDRYTFSIYMKKGNAANAPDIMQLSFGNGFANFNINTGVVTFSGSVISTSITNAGSGWWRCSITGGFTNTVTNNPVVFVAFVNNNPTAVVRPTYSNGAGATSRNVFVFGAQFELGVSATTYQQNLVHPRLPSGFVSFLSPTIGNYWVNSSGNLQNTPYENLVWPSVRISSLASGNSWKWLDAALGRAFTGNLDPNGTFGATRLNTGGVFNTNYMISYQTSGTNANNPSFPTSRIRTLILFVKQDSTDRYCGIRLANGGNTGDYNNNTITIKIDCLNGTLANNPTAYSITYSSQFVGDGWYKVCINRADSWDSMLFQTSTTLNTMNHSIGNGILIWGVQVLNGVHDINTPTYQRQLGYSTPRIDYLSGNTCPDYLLERSMTNTLLQSENFTSASWVKTNLSVSATTFLSPTNDSFSDLLIATDSNASIKQSGSGAVGLVTPRIFSVYLQRKTGSGPITLSMGSASATTNVTSTGWTRNYVVDSPRTGTYTSTSGNFTVTTSTPHGFETGDAIRFDATTGGGADVNIIITVTGPTTFTFTNGAATTSGNCTIYSNTGKILIDVSGDEVYAWGAQIEFSLTNTTSLGRIPSTYIPTTTTQVTTGSDSMVTNFSGSSSCSLFFEMSKVGGSNNTSQNFVFIGNETSFGLSSDGIGVSGTITPSLIWSKKEGNGAVTTISTLPYIPAENTKFKTLLTISGNSVDLWVDGTLMFTTTFANPNTLNYITFDASVGNIHGRLNKIFSWPTVLDTKKIDSLFSYPYYNAGYSPINYELQDVINRAHFEEFSLPTSTVLNYCDILITAMKNEGIWYKSDLFLNFTYNDINLSNFAKINWKNPNGGLGGIVTTVGDVAYLTTGFKGDGLSSYINTNYNLGIPRTRNYQTNNAGRITIISDAGTISGSGAFFESAAGSNANSVRFQNNIGHYINSTTNPLSVSVDMTGPGLKSIMRDSVFDVRLQNGTNVTSTTQTATIIPNVNQFLLRGNTTYVDATIACYYIGGSLTNSQISNFRDYYNTFLTNIGLTPFA